MRFGRDGIAGLIGLAVSLLLLPPALSLPKLPIVPVGPGFYPTIVLVFMALTSALLLLQDMRAQRQPAARGWVAARRRTMSMVRRQMPVQLGAARRKLAPMRCFHRCCAWLDRDWPLPTKVRCCSWGAAHP